MECELRLEGVSKRRLDRSGRSVEVLHGLDLEMPTAQLTVIIGPSGSGKSTLARLLNRLEDPTDGRILLRGTELKSLPLLALRRQVGLVPQQPFMFPGSVLDNLQLPFSYRGLPLPTASDDRLRQILARCGLAAELLERDARTLSVGQQQRVSLARTLLPGPAVLVLDEPTSALDRPSGDRLAETLMTICREERLTIVMVSHDLRLAERIADHLVYLEAGRVCEAGTAAQLLQHPASRELRQFLAGTGGGDA
ncbi:phosphate ABC transporter ATP-binding protein [Desulfuromonas carbonis]|uniref:ABC transporter ATP-binding protein n=1 Tax=Desulfuromonas sp. DDH964 TaxID=1823759 RepID=UPI00078C1AD9|nr:ATP-binding cassette domain-containing protein [Desulfuromonas sp. DDH964]AMV71977.1 amino acid ABC transporter ATP-binding protein [Desulfuromonas sp. DDH964]